MSYEKAIATVASGAGTTWSTTFPLKSDFGLFQGFRLVTTGDTSIIVTMTDGSGRIFFLDVGARDYTTAKDNPIQLNQVRTGLTGYVAGDATGTAITGIQGSAQSVIHSPVTVSATGATAADTGTLWFYYKSGIERSRAVLVSDGTSATAAIHLKNKFSRILGFNASNTTDIASKIKLTDADSRVIYLDAADRDYRAATAINRVMIAPDDTTTGLTAIPLNSTGAALGAAESASGVGTAVARSPITVLWTNAATNLDPLTIDLYHEV